MASRAVEIEKREHSMTTRRLWMWIIDLLKLAAEVSWE
jgi:hypothetical protein